jgi:hypothetical protein
MSGEQSNPQDGDSASCGKSGHFSSLAREKIGVFYAGRNRLLHQGHSPSNP